MSEKSIDTLIEDIYELLDENTHFEPSEESLKELGETLLFSVKRQLERKEGSAHLRMSNVGKKDRQLYYDIKSPKNNTFPPHLILRFLLGDIVEAILLFLAKEAGHTVEDQQKEVEIDGVKGHKDAKIDGWETDVKSTSARNFLKFLNGTLHENDEHGYIPQLSCYSQAEGNPKGAFLACDVNTGQLTLLKVHQMEMVNAADRINHVKGFLNKDTPPPEKCYPEEEDGKSGNMKLARPCTWCTHKDECWKDANNGKGLRKFKYANEIRYLTKVAKEPKVDEV